MYNPKIETFISVAESGSFSKAAQIGRMGVSCPLRYYVFRRTDEANGKIRRDRKRTYLGKIKIKLIL